MALMMDGVIKSARTALLNPASPKKVVHDAARVPMGDAAVAASSVNGVAVELAGASQAAGRVMVDETKRLIGSRVNPMPMDGGIKSARTALLNPARPQKAVRDAARVPMGDAAVAASSVNGVPVELADAPQAFGRVMVDETKRALMDTRREVLPASPLPFPPALPHWAAAACSVAHHCCAAPYPACRRQSTCSSSASGI